MGQGHGMVVERTEMGSWEFGLKGTGEWRNERSKQGFERIWRVFDEMPKKEKRVVGVREKVREWWQGVEEETGIGFESDFFGFESDFFGAFLLEKGEPSPILSVATSKESDILLWNFEPIEYLYGMECNFEIGELQAYALSFLSW